MSTENAVINIPEQFNFGYHSRFTSDYQPLLKDPSITVITLDFSRAVYLDSSAIGMINMLYRKASAENKKLVIRGAKGTAKDLIVLSNLQKLIPLE
ncbi:SpoIIAA family protein [Saccharospirillum sp. MSK14-1]|uniref:STAS domain-containing protein n=1 Tax=Saccharospirillum sp. MSK14-1 TaxID=1897632 RepID=UPI000D36C98F|nr:STAS domain-containing protein [Saccharospirillum sp. MSK14-1]PTY37482.1 SpoIIAA family protein [Saccharospirillum sp. MSK14-1]